MLGPLSTRRWTRVEYERLIDWRVPTGERLELLDGRSSFVSRGSGTRASARC